MGRSNPTTRLHRCRRLHQYIFPLLFFKRICDVYDEEYQQALDESDGDLEYAAFAEHYRFQIPDGAHWNYVREVTKNVGWAIQKATRAIELANPDRLDGIFGDARWTNKERLSDATLRDLIEHFSTLTLSLANVPEDELGVAYEFLIKKFADDSGHTAAEFYTNRTVVHLMTLMLQPQAGASIYDPTCGSGGMLLSCVAELQRQGEEYRSLRLYGQERNLMTSAIARMNLFLYGIEDFHIVRDDTLSNPRYLKGDRLRQFDVVLANPPYSIKQWDQTASAGDPEQKAKEIEFKITRRIGRHGNDPRFVKLGKQLEELKDRLQAGVLNSIEYLKLLLDLARDVLRAEKDVDPEEERMSAKAALTELFEETRNGDTPIIVERVVTDIDDIVRIVRFDGWQDTHAGQREVKKALRKTLLKYQLHKDQDLFDRAYGYIEQYY